ncbi:MAG: hypothetical protein Q8T11_03235 [Elusimicrobiota bacterium]|nr:hypothetical protein [Elusimicrobiota bacterium]
MPVRLLAVLALALAVPARAGTARVEVVPELGGLGSAPSASASASLSAAPLQLSANALVPAMSLGAPALAPVAAPAPAAAVAAVKPASAEGSPLLIKSLAAPALDVGKLGAGESAGAAERDFHARAQLGAPSALAAGAVAAPAAGEASGRFVSRLLKPEPKPGASAAGKLAAPDGYDRTGERMKAALKTLHASPAGTILPLGFAPTEKSLKAISELSHEVFLHRRKSDGLWLLARGDRHGVSGEWDAYDLALHNHPTARMGVYSMHSAYPSPEDLETAAGKEARFFVISEEGVVEWNSAVPKDVGPSLVSTAFGRFVMRIAFPALYPTLLARRGVAAELKPWRKVTTAWLESGAAPLNERVVIEDVIPALVAAEFPVLAAKLGRKVDAAYEADVLTRTNGYRMYRHSATTYKDHPDHVGIPDGHFRSDFGIRLMVKPDWRRLEDLSANYRPLFAHEYVHWLQNEGFVSTKYGAEIAAVAVEVLRAVELVGLDAVRAGRAGTVHPGVLSSFESGREWARAGFQNETMPYSKGALAGAAHEAGRAAGRPEAAWEFLNLVIAGRGALEPAAAWERLVGAR